MIDASAAVAAVNASPLTRDASAYSFTSRSSPLGLPLTIAAVASSVSACDVHSSSVIPPIESGSWNVALAHACSFAVSVPGVAGSSVDTLTSVKPKRAVKTPTAPVAFAHRSIVGGTSESAVGGAVAALVIAAESTLNVRVVSSSKSTPRLPPAMSTLEPKANCSGWATLRSAWTGIVIEVGVELTAA